MLNVSEGIPIEPISKQYLRDSVELQMINVRKALSTLIQEEGMQVVGTVVKEPDYFSCGHFYEGKRHIIQTTKSLDNLPVGTKIYVLTEELYG